jgi:hypothetical protein
MNRRSGVRAAGIVGMAVAAVGCGSEFHPDEAVTVELSIEQIPAQASCVHVSVTGARSVERDVDVNGGEGLVLIMEGLPPGEVRFGGGAFHSVCAAVVPGAPPAWSGDPVDLTLSAGEDRAVSLPLTSAGAVATASSAGCGGGSGTTSDPPPPTTPPPPPPPPAVTPQPLHINFQPSAIATPAGYLADVGDTFGDRGSGLSYGWSSSRVDQAFSFDPPFPGLDLKLWTVIEMAADVTASWEAAVPNGAYSVNIVAGGPFAETLQQVSVEGAPAVAATPGDYSSWVMGTVTVTVTDGRLTLTNTDGQAGTRLCYVDIVPVPAP